MSIAENVTYQPKDLDGSTTLDEDTNMGHWVFEYYRYFRADAKQFRADPMISCANEMH